jgi:hypothetical protein
MKLALVMGGPYPCRISQAGRIAEEAVVAPTVAESGSKSARLSIKLNK